MKRKAESAPNPRPKKQIKLINMLKETKEEEQQEEKGNSEIKAMPCRQPTFKDQLIIKKDGKIVVDEENALIFKTDVLSKLELDEYLPQALLVDRRSGKSGFGIKPRKEVCYTVDGKPYRYSNVSHHTLKYPEHVTKILPSLRKVVADHFPSHPFTQLSNGVDIIYSAEFARGGSISAHADDEDNWGLVIIFSLGQTRWLRVRRKSDKQWINVQMPHNSVVAMYGPSFQNLYTHQVDKLAQEEEVGTRLSLNVRFLKEEEKKDNTNE